MRRRSRNYLLNRKGTFILILVTPSKLLKDKILDYKKEWFDYGYTNVNGSSGLAYFDNFDDWLNHVDSIKQDRGGEDSLISSYFCVRESDNKIIGSCKLRLTTSPEKYGGHISYGIRPLERGKGYGKKQLQLILKKAGEQGMKQVKITCDKSNLASAHTIISCGGVLEGEIKENNIWKQQYRIDIN